MKALIDRINRLDAGPGVYLFKDKAGGILYIGKAGDLKKRMKSYFGSSTGLSPKTIQLVKQIADFDVIGANSEVEALLLEATLVKTHQPPYNISLKDDKYFPFIKITDELFPRVIIARRIMEDEALYFGPYIPASAANTTVKLIRETFGVRHCSGRITGSAKRPCIYYEMGQCPGPCFGAIGEKAYNRALDDVKKFLSGRFKPILKRLEKEMLRWSEALEFERAAKIRDEIAAIRDVGRKQEVISTRQEDQDVFGLACSEAQVCVQAMFIRAGRLLGRQRWITRNPGSGGEGEILTRVLLNYYSGNRFIPQEVILPFPIEELESISEWLRMLRGRRVLVAAPQRGRKKRLVSLAEENARMQLRTLAEKIKDAVIDRQPLLEEVQAALHLRNLPVYIECVDVSNTFGSEPVASLISFVSGLPDSRRTRYFKIKDVPGIDDYSMISEVVRRRCARLLMEGKGLPDLMVVDGGRGHLNAALAALDDLGVSDMDVIGIAKGPGRNEAGDRIVLRYPPIEVPVSEHSCLTLIQRTRNSAHRVAIGFHRKLRGKRLTHSELDDIVGIGPKRKRRLLLAFGSLDAVKRADVDELIARAGLDRRTAEALYARLKGIDAG